MLRTDYILKLKLMLAIVSAVLCVRSSFALGYSCFADISNVDAQVSFATYYDNYDLLGSNGVPTGSDARVIFGAESGYIKNDTIYSYVKDYQGNIRSVVRQDGAVVESTDYYPYGKILSNFLLLRYLKSYICNSVAKLRINTLWR